VDIKYYFIRDLIKDRTIKLNYIASKNNRVDILTKVLNRVKFKKLRIKLGVKDSITNLGN
jgi:hypothetical protein